MSSYYYLLDIKNSRTPASGYRYYRLLFAKWSSYISYQSVKELQFKWNGTWQTNAMSGNSTGTIGGLSATVSASSEFVGYLAYSAFDNSSSTNWSGAENSGYYGKFNWLKVDFGTAVNITGYRLTCGLNSQYAKDFILQGSSDNSTWYVLDSRIDQNTSTQQEYTVTSVAGSYSYYRWQTLRVASDNYVYLREIPLKWSNTWQTNAKTADATGNGTIGGLDAIISASSTNHSGVLAWRAFDGVDASAGWASAGNSFPTGSTSTTTYIQAQLGSAVALQGYKMWSQGTNPAVVGWELLGSNDGSSWYLLDFRGDESTTTAYVTYDINLI